MRTGVTFFLAALFLVTFFPAAVALAQDSAAIHAAEAACGPGGVNFDVKDDNSHHTVQQPETGKAEVYVIQEIREGTCIGGCLTTKIAVDGTWVGANHHDSYLFFAVEPGEHHLCANWQSHLERATQVFGLTHFAAEAGQVYFFRTRVVGAFFDFEPIDSDMGRLFVASIPMSVSHPKK